MNGMELVSQLVKSGALGLFMTGGRSSFAVGGYYKSPLDDIMPVTMEQRQEIRKSQVAVVVVLDRSGSMSMTIHDGRTKMDLANLGTAEVFKLLAPTDFFSAIAVDSTPHIVIPLSPVSTQPNAESAIRGIRSMGGGIYVYTGLVSAVHQMTKTNVVTRHIILFADAADAEEPGQYHDLLAECRISDITVSVIALGKETDSDADFLKEVARLGGGICYFTENANELPRIFVEDTFAMVRNTFIEGETQGAFTPSVQTLSSANVFGQPATLKGYNLCYAAPQADVQFVTQDENKATTSATPPRRRMCSLSRRMKTKPRWPPREPSNWAARPPIRAKRTANTRDRSPAIQPPPPCSRDLPIGSYRRKTKAKTILFHKLLRTACLPSPLISRQTVRAIRSKTFPSSTPSSRMDAAKTSRRPSVSNGTAPTSWSHVFRCKANPSAWERSVGKGLNRRSPSPPP